MEFHAVSANNAITWKKVPSVNAEDLEEAVKDSNVLVVFYSSQCMHCYDFVEKGGQDAPIEQLSRKLSAAGGSKVKVVKFNVDEDREPGVFTVEYVPTIYLVAKGNEKMSVFEGYDTSPDTLKGWVLNEALPPVRALRFAAVAAATPVPKWACAIAGLPKPAGVKVQGAMKFHAVTANEVITWKKVPSVNAEDLEEAVKDSNV